MFLDGGVHLGLGYRRLIGLVMPPPSIAYEVDDHISLEGISKIHRQLGNKNHRFRVVGVDMENRRLDHFGDIGAVLGRPGVIPAVGGKSDLVVENYMQGATGFVAPGLGHLERLHHHTLPRERCITVDDNRHYRVPVRIVPAVLPGPHRALDHGGYNLQVGRIECQGQMHFAAAGHQIGGKSLVVLHIPGATVFGPAFKFVKQLTRVFTQDIDQHIQPAPVGHANYDLLGTVATDSLDRFRHHGYQALTTLKTEALGTGIL